MGSSDVNTQVTVAYMFAVFISLLYFNSRLTIFACFISLISAIFSTILSAEQAVQLLWHDVTPLQYVLTTGSGRLIEIVASSVIFISVSILARNLLKSLYQRNERIYAMQNQVVYGFADIIESRDGTTGEHVKRTSQVVSLITEYLIIFPTTILQALQASHISLKTLWPHMP